MAFQTRSDHAAMSEINVTPLVDVMLVLLVIFIVTAPRAERRRQPARAGRRGRELRARGPGAGARAARRHHAPLRRHGADQAIAGKRKLSSADFADFRRLVLPHAPSPSPPSPLPQGEGVTKLFQQTVHLRL